MCHDHSYQEPPPWLERAWITAEQEQEQARNELLRILVGRRQILRQALDPRPEAWLETRRPMVKRVPEDLKAIVAGRDIHWPAAQR